MEPLGNTSLAIYKNIFRSFSLMGWTAFGGPRAHVGIFYRIFVENKNQITSSVLAKLVVLGQCMPRPIVTHISFAIGVAKKGVKEGILSGMHSQYPRLPMMVRLGLLVAVVVA